jgi:hypothetical protein
MRVAHPGYKQEKEMFDVENVVRFVVEVDILEIMGSAAICIGSQEFEKLCRQG